MPHRRQGTGEAGAEGPAEEGVTIEGLVTSVEQREQIKLAASEAGTSARRFIGEAALTAATGEGFQLARLEHVTAAQRDLTIHLEELRDELVGTTRFARESVAQHEETHARLEVAIAAINRAHAHLEEMAHLQVRSQAQVEEALDGHRLTREQLAEAITCIHRTQAQLRESLEGHATTQAMLARAMDAHRDESDRIALAVSSLRDVCRELVDAMAAVGRQVSRLCRHLGLATPDGRGEPDC